MIGKITKGRGFRGLAEYLLRNGRGQIVAGPMAGRTPRELAAEFGQLRRLNPKLGKAVAHFSLSPAPGDPPLDQSQWQSIAERFMAEMGFDEAWCGVIHRDTDHEHLHLMACRIDRNGKTVSDANDYRKAEAAIRRIEADFGLIAVTNPKRKPIPTTKGEQTMNDTPQASSPDELPDLAETTEPGILPGASIGEELTERKRRDLKRLTVEDDYEPLMRHLFGPELSHIYKHAGGAVLYFPPEKQRIADAGHTLTAMGGMSDALAARRIVTIAKSRGWPSISFTGSPRFVELAMREALDQGIRVVPKGPEQQAILEKIMAERQGLSIASNPILTPDGPIAQTLPKTAPIPEPPRAPLIGATPVIPTLRERLHERRKQLGLIDANEPTPPASKGPKMT